jgi:hypothetical protein
MKKLLILTLPFLLTGCSILPSIFSPAKNQIPQEPQKSFWDKEEIKQNADIINEVSDKIYTTGTNSHSYESSVLKDSSDVMTLVTGVPAEKIDWTNREEVKKLHNSIRQSELEYKKREHEWKSQIDAISRDKKALEEENGVLKKFKDWFWLSVIALAVLTFLCPTLGFTIIKFLVGRAKRAGEVAVTEAGRSLKGQFQQVTAAIDQYKNQYPDEASTLLDLLKKETDSTTREMIKNIKRGKLD